MNACIYITSTKEDKTNIQSTHQSIETTNQRIDRPIKRNLPTNASNPERKRAMRNWTFQQCRNKNTTD
eukprot:11170802-Lingulodinium_polyedra.AAC.1